jgi:hypothetical protein
VREKYCWLVAGGWFVLREKYCWLVADKPNERAVGHGLAHVHPYLNKDRSIVTLTSSIRLFGYVTFYILKLPNSFSFAGR